MLLLYLINTLCNFSPLRRMTAGMILAGLSFVVAAIIQMEIDVSYLWIVEVFIDTYRNSSFPLYTHIRK